MKIEKFFPLLKKILLVVALFIFTLLLGMISFCYLYESKINEKIKSTVNRRIHGKLDYRTAKLTFFDEFPTLTVSFSDLTLFGSAPFERDTLLSAQRASLGVNLMSLIRSNLIVDQITIDNGLLNVQVDSLGAANYNIYTATADSTQDDTPSESSIAIEKITLKNTSVYYSDQSIPVQLYAKNINYVGKADFSAAIFDLHTDVDIDQFSLTFDGETYVEDKKIKGQLITKINTNNLSFVFEKNDIHINQLPVQFKGSFAFLSNGYHLDMHARSKESTLKELLSLVPKSYSEWFQKIQASGNAVVNLNLVGDYIVEQNKNPDVDLALKINDGNLRYANAVPALTNWNTDLRVTLPQLNIDSLKLELKQFDFKLGDGYFNSHCYVQGFDPMQIDVKVDSKVDLSNLQQIAKWPDVSLSGLWILNGFVKGEYATEIKKIGYQRREIKQLKSIPAFHITNSLTNGSLKFMRLPQAIPTIAYELVAEASDGNIHTAKIALKNIHIQALKNVIQGYAIVKDFRRLDIDSDLKAQINLADIKQVIPMDSLELAGNLATEIRAKGYWDNHKKILPVIKSYFQLKNGYIKPVRSPIPLEEIQIDIAASSDRGSFRDAKIRLSPLSFKLAGEPFVVKANLENLENVHYAVSSKGTLNLEPLYNIFAIGGTHVKGTIATNFNLAGLQSDALRGRYSRLNNEGTASIHEIRFRSDLFPHPFQIAKGNFSFKREKLNVDDLKMTYAGNTIQVQGYADNIVNYLTRSTDLLKGKFTLSSKQINLDDFSVYDNATSSTSNNSVSGVILLPNNLDLMFSGRVDRIKFGDLTLQNFKSDIVLIPGQVKLVNTVFNLAGTSVKMEGNYKPLQPKRARFDYAIQADSFDIQRAYKEVSLFSQMVTSAKDAYGIISLDYKLSGLLNADMYPILPSIQGEGSLVLDKIKFKGFKLLNSISNRTSKEKLADGETKKVTIKTSIKNNVMTIQRTKMKMAGFRPRFEGQVGLDGRMNIGFRLGLPPFGIFGIPMRISGTSENFKIKLGKYSEDDLDEELDDDDKKLYEASVTNSKENQ